MTVRFSMAGVTSLRGAFAMETLPFIVPLKVRGSNPLPATNFLLQDVLRGL